jgi:hypothetical protein
MNYVFCRRAQLLCNQKKIHPVYPKETRGNIRDYRDDFTFKAGQKLFQFGMIPGHPEIESVHPVFHDPHSFPNEIMKIPGCQ